MLQPNINYHLIPLTTTKQALKHHKWNEAMHAEMNALQQNKTWELAPREQHQNTIRCKGIFQ